MGLAKYYLESFYSVLVIAGGVALSVQWWIGRCGAIRSTFIGVIKVYELMALVLEFTYYTGVNAPIHLRLKTWVLEKKMVCWLNTTITTRWGSSSTEAEDNHISWCTFLPRLKH